MHIFLQFRQWVFLEATSHTEFSLLLEETGTFNIKENWYLIEASNNHKHLFSSPSWNTHWNQALCMLTEGKLHYVKKFLKNKIIFSVFKKNQNKCSQSNNSCRPQYLPVAKLMPKSKGWSAGQKFPCTFSNSDSHGLYSSKYLAKWRHMGEGKCPSRKVWGDLLFCVGFFFFNSLQWLFNATKTLSIKKTKNKSQGG